MRAHRTVTPICRPRRQATSILSVSAGAMLAASWALGCSVIYDLDAKQCESTADCQALGGVFTDLVCTENVCQLPANACESHSECLNDDFTPRACIPKSSNPGAIKECVNLTSTECPLVLPLNGDKWRENLATENPVILAATGVILQQTPDNLMLNYELALRDISDGPGGIGPSYARKVVMVGCQADVTPEELTNEMAHLDRLQIPGMISSFSAETLQSAFTQIGNNEPQMFFMSAQESDPVLETFPDDGRIWTVFPGADVIARVYAPLLTQTITHLGLTSDVRVAVVAATNERFLNNSAATIRNTPDKYGLMFNGDSVSGNNGTSHYLGIDVDLGATVDAEKLSALLAFKPHVVISAAGPEFVRDVMASLESGWDTSSGAQAKPFYILSPYNFNRLAVLNAISAEPSLRTRVLGVNGASALDTSVYDTYTAHWDTVYRTEAAGVRGYENFYDAAYYLLYAASSAAAAGTCTADNCTVKTGDEIREGMRRLLSGMPYDVGTADMRNALTQLNVPNNGITLNGTLGPPDFNTLTGNRDKGGGSVFCVDSTVQWKADVLRYQEPSNPEDVTTAGLTGSLIPDCFSTF